MSDTPQVIRITIALTRDDMLRLAAIANPERRTPRQQAEKMLTDLLSPKSQRTRIPKKVP